LGELAKRGEPSRRGWVRAARDLDVRHVPPQNRVAVVRGADIELRETEGNAAKPAGGRPFEADDHLRARLIDHTSANPEKLVSNDASELPDLDDGFTLAREVLEHFERGDRVYAAAWFSFAARGKHARSDNPGSIGNELGVRLISDGGRVSDPRECCKFYKYN
jgi:hypothetical protein